jgi:hypothetical protein
MIRDRWIAGEVVRFEPEGDVVFAFGEDVVGDAEEPNIGHLDPGLLLASRIAQSSGFSPNSRYPPGGAHVPEPWDPWRFISST